MVTTAPEETSDRFDIIHALAPEDREHEGSRLRTTVKRFMDALQEIAALPCASDLPLCHNPGCASCRARRALAGRFSP
jgi:hypothetical protein